MTGRPPTVVELDALDPDACRAALAPLFEGAPRFLARLCDSRPFGGGAQLFANARRIAREMPEPEQVELLDAHPRLGAPPGTVSAHSYIEQGYDREAAGAAARLEWERIAAQLKRLNAAYESRFGFRYCVFVAGRSRAALLPELERALEAGRDAEIARGLEAVVDIAMDRYRTSRASDDDRAAGRPTPRRP